MSTSYDSSLPSREVQENQHQRKSKKWKVANSILDLLLISTIIFLGIWVLILKLSHVPGVHLQMTNESGQALKNVQLTLPWCEYVQNELTTERRKDWWTPYTRYLSKDWQQF